METAEHLWQTPCIRTECAHQISTCKFIVNHTTTIVGPVALPDINGLSLLRVPASADLRLPEERAWNLIPGNYDQQGFEMMKESKRCSKHGPGAQHSPLLNSPETNSLTSRPNAIQPAKPILAMPVKSRDLNFLHSRQ